MTISLYSYSQNGKGHEVLEIFAKISHALAEISMSSFILLLGCGWTITFQDLNADDHIEILVPILAFISIVHVLCASLTFVDLDAYHKYHDFSGVEGWVLFVTKLGIWFYFVYLTRSTWKTVEKRAHPYFLM